jgi:hypothetical protein
VFVGEGVIVFVRVGRLDFEGVFGVEVEVRTVTVKVPWFGVKRLQAVSIKSNEIDVSIHSRNILIVFTPMIVRHPLITQETTFCTNLNDISNSGRFIYRFVNPELNTPV